MGLKLDGKDLDGNWMDAMSIAQRLPSKNIVKSVVSELMENLHFNSEVCKNDKKSENCINIFHLIVRSLGKNSVELKTLVLNLEQLPHVLCFSKTWLCKSGYKDSMLAAGILRMQP